MQIAALLRDELQEVVDASRRLKQRAGALDFVDLLLRARDLLVSDIRVRAGFHRASPASSWTSFRTPIRFRPRSCCCWPRTIRARPTGGASRPVPGKLFIVGDPKQAIYRFRRADVDTYRDVCEHLEARGASRLHCTRVSARPRRSSARQRGLRARMQAIARRCRPTTWRSRRIAETRRRSPPWSLCRCPSRTASGQVAGYAIEKSLPDGVGAFVAWLLNESGWTVTVKSTLDELPMEIPIQPRHVCILFRRFLHFGDGCDAPLR